VYSKKKKMENLRFTGHKIEPIEFLISMVYVHPAVLLPKLCLCISV